MKSPDRDGLRPQAFVADTRLFPAVLEPLMTSKTGAATVSSRAAAEVARPSVNGTPAELKEQRFEFFEALQLKVS